MKRHKQLHRIRWQFSLRTLLFLTTIVALCSMLIGVSAIAAVVVVPLFAIALVRTLRINQPLADEASMERQRRGLVATFCTSIVLILTLLAVSVATALFALVAAALVVTDFVARSSKPVVAKLQPMLKQAWRTPRAAGRQVASRASYSNVQRALNWSSACAVVVTRYLVAATSTLHRRYWHLDLRK